MAAGSGSWQWQWQTERKDPDAFSPHNDSSRFPLGLSGCPVVRGDCDSRPFSLSWWSVIWTSQVKEGG